MKVRVVPAQPHCFAYGGFDIQMHRTLDVLRGLGLDARPLDFWSRDKDFDILHIWGFDTDLHLTTARFAKRYGKKVVLTPLLQYLTPYAWVRYAGALVEGTARRRIAMAKLVDRFLVVNEEQGDTLRFLYRVPQEKIAVIPTILEDGFFEPGSDWTDSFDGFSDFLICSGNICARKNQLRLAQAAIATQTPILFAGSMTGGEESYGAAFRALIAPHSFIRWRSWLEWKDLGCAYRAARGVVLPSFEEQQPTVGLEAAALGKPLLLGNKPYARQKFYRNAFLANPASVEAIGKGLRALMTQAARYTPPRDLVEECRAAHSGLRLKAIFESLV